ncbi:MAG: sulfurtransferase [Acidobacteria bacterium]|nr:sulfurtransferase [Acidobacteriota bacterium]
MKDELQIEPQALRERLNGNERPLLIDVREPWEYDICRLDSAQLIPLGELPQRYQELLDAEAVVLYCHHGIRSLDAAAWLRQQGVEGAQSLAGGIDRWAREIDPALPRY